MFGNPYRISYKAHTWYVTDSGLHVYALTASLPEAQEYATDAYRAWLSGTDWPQPVPDPLPDYARTRTRLLMRLPDLTSRDLVCWCPLLFRCHADVLLEIANAYFAPSGPPAAAQPPPTATASAGEATAGETDGVWGGLLPEERTGL